MIRKALLVVIAGLVCSSSHAGVTDKDWWLEGELNFLKETTTGAGTNSPAK